MIVNGISVVASFYGDKYDDTMAGAIQKIRCSELAKDILLIENFWSAKQCDDFITQSETTGFEQAKIQTDLGQKVVESIRNNRRIMYRNEALANQLWETASQFAPQYTGNSVAIGLNELFRIYKYEPDQKFKKHRDESFIRNESESSYYTFMIYLNDDFAGGETTFNNITVKPRKGAALIFLHSLEHEGSNVKSGIKYVLRTDIMYRLTGKEA
jgi:hypothetical protein